MSETDPQQVEITVNHQNSPSFLRRTMAIGGVGVLAAAGTVAFSALKGCDGPHIPDPTPKQQATIRAKAALSDIELPDSTALVDGVGSADAWIQLRPHFGIGGAILNPLVAPHADMKAHAGRVGDVSINAAYGAVSLSPYAIEHSDKLGIKASVDVSKLFVKKDTDYRKLPSGENDLQSKADFFAIPTLKGVTKRTGWVTEWADSTLKDTCSRAIIPSLTAGVQKMVGASVTSTAGFLDDVAGLKNDTTSQGIRDTADILTDAAGRHIEVSYYVNHRQPDGMMVRTPIAPYDVVPTGLDKPPTSAQFAAQLGKHVEQVVITPGSNTCTLSSKAAAKQNRWMQENGAQPTPAV